MKFLMKNILCLALSVAVGYFTFLASLGSEGFSLVSQNVSEDVLLRRNFLVKTLSKRTSPQDYFVSGTSQVSGEWTLVTYSMTVAALTNIAMQEPSTAPESSQLIARLIENALQDDVAYFDTVAWSEHPLAKDVLEKDEGHIGYYGHLNLMLGCYALLNNDGRFRDLHLKVSEAIARRMRKYPHRHIETYPQEMYPPDNTVSTASLRIAEQALGQDYSVLIEEWIAATKNMLDPKTGLPVFQIDTATGTPLQQSRGSHIGWNSFYLPLIDEVFAAAQYEQFRKIMLKDFGHFAGFREYYRGKQFWMDRDAGPVIFQVSFSATAFGIAGARHAKDAELLTKLIRLIEVLGVSGRKDDQKRYLASPIVGDAIMLAMKTACPWRPLWRTP